MSTPTTTVVQLELGLTAGMALGALRLRTLASLYDEWRLNALKIEFIQYTSSVNVFAIGITEDSSANVGALSIQDMAEFHSSRCFNTGSGLKQEFVHRPRRRWLKTSADSETTAAALRQVIAGQIWGAWQVASAAGQSGALMLHYDISFRSPVPAVGLTSDLGLSARKDATGVINGRAKETELSKHEVQDDYVQIPRSMLLNARAQSSAETTALAVARSAAPVVCPRPP